MKAVLRNKKLPGLGNDIGECEAEKGVRSINNVGKSVE